MKLLRRFGWVQFVAMLALVAVGTIAIRSAGGARAELVFHGMWKDNLLSAAVGIVLYLAIAFTDYRKVLPLVAAPAYAVSLVLLSAVLVVGSTVYGGKRWLWFFQPSEISKLCVIAFLAYLYGGAADELWRRARGFVGFLAACLIVGVPSLLILLEPDLGTTLVLVPSALVVLLAARVWSRGMTVAITLVAIVATLVLGAVYEAERPGASPERHDAIMRYLPLKDHQVRRVKVFLFPDDDISGDGYTLRQAKISIGSGGLSGKGLGRGENNHLKYLPQSISMNDFIFCVWAEETGFLGSLLLLALYGALLVPCTWTAFRSGDGRGRLLAIGIATLIFAHVFINIAMSIGLVPITGLPLPFISSGRTFLLTVMAGLGLVQSVAIWSNEKN